MRKIKYGHKVSAITHVMRDIAEEIIDLTTRLDSEKIDASTKLVEQHKQGLIERIQIRGDLLERLTKLL